MLNNYVARKKQVIVTETLKEEYNAHEYDRYKKDIIELVNAIFNE
ncbi:MAG: hypothetical protein RR920_08895 [Lachnospiraceae bacterium]